MKTFNITITEEHLAKAISQPWAARNCIFAVVLSEAIGEPIDYCGRGLAQSVTDRRFYQIEDKAVLLQRTFDDAHQKPKEGETYDEVKLLLPLTCGVQET